MLRTARDWKVSVAYGAAASRAIASGLWLGIEASGQPEHGGGHFAGPALTFEHDAGSAEVEIGLAYQRRIVGDGPSDSLRVFVQLNL